MRMYVHVCVYSTLANMRERRRKKPKVHVYTPIR